MIARAALLYLAIFICVLVALSAGAYAFMAREYTSMLAPALGTPEGVAALGAAMRRVVVAIAAIDAPLILIVGIASYALARMTIAPLAAARERERIFAADAAHELRSPLTAIASVAQAARITATPESRAAFDTIARSVLDASAIVADLLTLARSPGRGALQCEPVDLAALVNSCTRDVAPLANSRRIEIESASESAIVDGDARRLKELIRNLLENAVRHASAHVRITSQRNGSVCEILVDDDGGGVALQDRERIFERFYRRTDDGGGAGLGLAIVRWIAHAHNGSVTVGDAPGGGARFTASLPAYP